MPVFQRKISMLFAVATLLLVAAPVLAGNIVLRWDPVNDPDLGGYKVYYGPSPGSYTKDEDVGNVTTHTLTNLANCTDFYIAVKAYDQQGKESDGFSNEEKGWARPVLLSASPSAGNQGEQLDITITGNNFMSGATVEFADPKITVNSVTINSCRELIVNVRIGATANPGSTDLDVVNPDRVYGTGVGIFTVTEATVAPIITSQPVDQTVGEGGPATFRVTADGTPPLSYQWKKDGVDIPGANGDTYTTPPTTPEDDGSLFHCSVSNAYGSTDSDTALLTVTQSGPRVSDGLVALYDFEEGSGSVVRDVSGVGQPLDLTVADTTATTWISGGLSVNSATIVESGSPATKVIDAVKASNALTVEAWIKPANNTQSGHARIVTVSQDPYERNVTLGQDADRYAARLRSTGKDLNGLPELTGTAGSATAGLAHVVFTRDTAGVEKLYVGGAQETSQTVAGSFSNWSDAHRLAVANEFTDDRAWLGELHLVAIYDRALSASEVQQNFDAGPDGESTVPPNEDTTPPEVAATDPADGQGQVNQSIHPTVTFSEPMAPSTITAGTVRLLGPDGPVPQATGSPTFSPDGKTATIVPASPLAPNAHFKVNVLGTDIGVRDKALNPMARTFNHVEGFKTQNKTPPGQVKNLHRKDNNKGGKGS